MKMIYFFKCQHKFKWFLYHPQTFYQSQTFCIVSTTKYVLKAVRNVTYRGRNKNLTIKILSPKFLDFLPTLHG